MGYEREEQAGKQIQQSVNERRNDQRLELQEDEVVE